MKSLISYCFLVLPVLLLNCSDPNANVLEEQTTSIAAGEIVDPSNYISLNKSIELNRTSDEIFRIELFADEEIGFSLSKDMDMELLRSSIVFMTIALTNIDLEMKFPNVSEEQGLFFVKPVNKGDVISSAQNFFSMSPQTIFYGKDNSFLTIQNSFKGFYLPFEMQTGSIRRVGWLNMRLVLNDVRVEGFEVIDLAWIELEE